MRKQAHVSIKTPCDSQSTTFFKLDSTKAPATQQQQEQQPTMIVPPSNAGVEPKAMMVEARHAFVTFAAMPGPAWSRRAHRGCSWVCTWLYGDNCDNPICLNKHVLYAHFLKWNCIPKNQD